MACINVHIYIHVYMYMRNVHPFREIHIYIHTEIQILFSEQREYSDLALTVGLDAKGHLISMQVFFFRMT